MNRNNKEEKIETSIPESANKRQTAFLQIPIEIKEDVEAYIDSITEPNDRKSQSNSNDIASLSTQGCFLVIALEKIEKITNCLKACLEIDVADDGTTIKTEIRKVLTSLN